MSSTKTFLNLERIARIGQKQHTFHFGTYGQQKLPGVHARELLHTKFLPSRTPQKTRQELCDTLSFHNFLLVGLAARH